MSREQSMVYDRGPSGHWVVMCPYCRGHWSTATSAEALRAGLAHEEVCDVA